MKKYNGNRNTTLIIVRAQRLALCLRPPRYLLSFRGVQARLFSGVTSVFIVDAQSNPQPDFQDMARHRYELRSLPLPSRGGFQPGQLLSPPNSTAQTLLWPTSTLSLLQFSLLAAFITISGKRWFNLSAQVRMRGFVIDRSCHR